MGSFQQRYVSGELTHFAGRHSQALEDQYQILLQIVRSGQLRRDPNYAPGTSPVSGRTQFGPRAHFSRRRTFDFPGVCFCDIPLADLEIHVHKYSCFGIAFPRDFLVQRGASPVFYIANDSRIEPAACEALGVEKQPCRRSDLFDLLVSEFIGIQSRLALSARSVPPESCSGSVKDLKEAATQMAELQTYLTEYVFSYCVPFEAALDDAHHDHYYMEREWRILGDLVFDIADVERLIVPRQFGKRLRGDVPKFNGQLHFLDPRSPSAPP
jgi:hypothetical protein